MTNEAMRIFSHARKRASSNRCAISIGSAAGFTGFPLPVCTGTSFTGMTTKGSAPLAPGIMTFRVRCSLGAEHPSRQIKKTARTNPAVLSFPIRCLFLKKPARKGRSPTHILPRPGRRVLFFARPFSTHVKLLWQTSQNSRACHPKLNSLVRKIFKPRSIFCPDI